MEKSKHPEGLGPVLVASDLSETADEAVRQAHGWARRTGRPLSVLHVMPNPVPIAPLAPQDAMEALERAPEVESQVLDLLEQRVGRVTGRGPGRFAIALQRGGAAELILAEAERVGALLVIAPSRKSSLEAAIVGSVAEAVLEQTRVPVLLARLSPDGGPVLAATDLTDDAEPVMLSAATEAAQRGGKLLLAHSLEVAHPVTSAFDPSNSLSSEALASLRAGCKEALSAALGRLEAGGEPLVLEGPPQRTLVEAARTHGASLVVIGAHRGARLGRLGNVARAVARGASCSVLILPPTRAGRRSQRPDAG
ncbi:MAG: universal stress protein [Myxococcales bacterium]|nr:universal stress protein [Myxococcales bacterium]